MERDLLNNQIGLPLYIIKEDIFKYLIKGYRNEKIIAMIQDSYNNITYNKVVELISEVRREMKEHQIDRQKDGLAQLIAQLDALREYTDDDRLRFEILKYKAKIEGIDSTTSNYPIINLEETSGFNIILKPTIREIKNIDLENGDINDIDLSDSDE